MSKYHQKALETLQAFNNLVMPDEYPEYKIGLKWIIRDLQELVDRDKPMKPHQDGIEDWDRSCPNCRTDGIWSEEMMYKHNYCSNCGQAIDWSEDE